MSVRATDSLIADIVTVSAIPNSPKMVVLAVEPESKQITTVWFDDQHSHATGTFPAGALDRFEAKAPPAKGRK